jgi:hypothetical protein
LQAHLLNNPSIVVNAVNPGYCYSGFRKGFSGIMAFFDYLMERFFALSTEEGGRQLVYAAVGGAGEEEKLKGGYVSFGEVIEPSDFSMSAKGLELEEKYWVSTCDSMHGSKTSNTFLRLVDTASGCFERCRPSGQVDH